MGYSYPTRPPDPRTCLLPPDPWGEAYAQTHIGRFLGVPTREQRLISELQIQNMDLAERVAALEARVPPEPEVIKDG